MIEARQHIPSFCEGFEPHAASVATLDELLALPWIKAWTEDARFDYFAVSQPAEYSALLMAMMKDGSFWVVAYLKADAPLDLPEWKAPAEAVH